MKEEESHDISAQSWHRDAFNNYFCSETDKVEGSSISPADLRSVTMVACIPQTVLCLLLRKNLDLVRVEDDFTSFQEDYIFSV